MSECETTVYVRVYNVQQKLKKCFHLAAQRLRLSTSITTHCVFKRLYSRSISHAVSLGHLIFYRYLYRYQQADEIRAKLSTLQYIRYLRSK